MSPLEDINVALRRRNDCFYNQVHFSLISILLQTDSHDRTLYHITWPIFVSHYGHMHYTRKIVFIYRVYTHTCPLCSEAQPGQKDWSQGKVVKWWKWQIDDYTHIQVEPNRPHWSIWFTSPWFRERLFFHFFFFANDHQHSRYIK